MSHQAPEIVKLIKQALDTGKFEYTSNKSIQIYLLEFEEKISKPTIRMIEVSWREIE